MKSIMDTKKGECYICAKLYGNRWQQVTQEHHIFYGTANRRLSEKYGLKVDLCIPHHTAGSEAVHLNHNMDIWLKGQGKLAFMKKYPDLNFREIFGKNFEEET